MRTPRLAAGLPALMLALVPSALLAQADTGDLFEIEDEPVPSWRATGDLLVRGDHVGGLPGGRSDLDRLRARLRLGVERDGDTGLRFGAAAMLAGGSDANRDNLRNNDNERSDDIALDALWIGGGGERWRWQAGKRASELSLTPLLWDADHRPIGIDVVGSALVGGFHRWRAVAGVHALDHPLGGDAHYAAVQLGGHWREGAATSVSGSVAYLHFDDLQGLAAAGLGRGNSLQQGRYVHDYRLLDVQVTLHRRLASGPLELRLDLVRNLGADGERDAARASAVFGDRWLARQWEAGLAWQRIQRDAVLAAANSDDWWFHAGARGVMPWIGYGLDGNWALRLAAFVERRDGLEERTERVLLDLERRW